MRIVLPFYSGDVWLALKNIAWYKELDEHLDYECILASDNDTDHRPVAEAAQGFFKSIRILKYNRAQWNHKVLTKWPIQQNNAFVNTCNFMATLKPYDSWFWSETDAPPLKPGWLQTIEAEYLKGNKPFGSHINPDNGIVNGVGVWPANVGRLSPKCFQCTLYWPDQEPWDAYASNEIRPRTTPLNNVMQHQWNLPGQTLQQAPTFPDIASVGKYIRPGVVLFHRCKDGTLIDRMREIRGNKISVTMQGIDKVDRHQEMPKVDIFIVSFRRDLEFTKYCLKSIAKFATGFHKTVLVVPSEDKVLFLRLAAEHPFVELKTFKQVAGKGMLHHEAIVCSADQFSDADYILHIDSDCIFKEPVTPSDYFKDGKPVMLKEPFEQVGEVVGPWQDAVETALGFKPFYETMRRHPAVHPRELYPQVRKAIEAHTGKPFLDYVLSCRNEFPQGFAEFPTLGAWAIKYAPDLHHWIDLSKEARPADKLYQFWSKGGLDFVPDSGPHKGRSYRSIIEEAGL